MNVVLGLVADQFDKGLSKASKSLNRSAKNMQRVGKNLSLSVTAPLAAIGASSFKVAADFELSMAKVKAISGATGSEFENLEKQARDLGSSTIFAASEVSGLQLELSKLGFSAKDIQDSTGAILALAQATGEELGPTAETVAKTLNQFGLDASESGDVADLMAAAFSSSALDLEKFGSAMANAGPVAAQFGFSLQETTQLLGVLANNGIEGADAGTKLKMAFSAIAAEGGDVKNVFNALIGANADYTTAMDVVKKRAAILVPVLAGNRDESEKLAKALDESTGSAQRMAKIMDDTAAGSMAAMRSAVEAAQISLGTALAPVIQEVAGFVTDLAKRFSELDRDTQKNIVAFAGIAAAIGPVLIVVGKATTGFMSLAKGISKATKFLAANPYLAVAAAVVALGAALVDVAQRFRDVDGAAKAMTETNNRALEITAKQRAEVNTLVAIASDMNVEEERRAAAIAELNRISPEHLGNLSLENINTEAGRKSLAKFNDELLRRARLTAAQDRLVEIQREIAEANKDLGAEGVNDLAEALFVASGNIGAAQELRIRTFRQTIQDLKEEENKLLEIIKGTSVDTPAPDGPNPVPGVEETNEELEELQRQLAASKAALAAFQNQRDQGGSDEKVTPLGTILDPDMFSGDDQFFSNLTDQINELQTAIAGTENFNPFGDLTALQEAEARLSSLKSLYLGLPEALQKSADGVVLFNQILAEQEGLKNMKKDAEEVVTTQDVLIASAEQVGASIASSVGQAADAQKGFTSAVLNSVKSVVAARLAEAASTAITNAFETAKATGPAAAIVGPVLAGIAFAGVKTLFNQIPAFAQGGMVLGPQLALVGDNPSGREAIIPFERMGEFVNMVGGGRSSNVNVSGRIDGTTIVLANERATRNRGR